jgi:hypothetical protein
MGSATDAAYVAYNMNVPAGQLIVACVFDYGAGVNTVDDSAGNTYVPLRAGNVGIFWAWNCLPLNNGWIRVWKSDQTNGAGASIFWVSGCRKDKDPHDDLSQQSTSHGGGFYAQCTTVAQSRVAGTLIVAWEIWSPADNGWYSSGGFTQGCPQYVPNFGTWGINCAGGYKINPSINQVTYQGNYTANGGGVILMTGFMPEVPKFGGNIPMLGM